MSKERGGTKAQKRGGFFCSSCVFNINQANTHTHGEVGQMLKKLPLLPHSSGSWFHIKEQGHTCVLETAESDQLVTKVNIL